LKLFLSIQIGNSRTTGWRKKKAAISLENHAVSLNLPKIDDFFKNLSKKHAAEVMDVEAIPESNNAEDSEQDFQANMEQAEEKLRSNLLKIKNKKSPYAQFTSYQLNRYFVVQQYLKLCLEGKKKIEASEIAAKNRGFSVTGYSLQNIRMWADCFLKDGLIPHHQHGVHAKRQSILSDEDVKKRAIEWLRSQDPLLRSPQGLKLHLENTILPERLGESGTIAVRTITKYMHAWGFAYRKVGQNVSVFCLLINSIRSVLKSDL
jgi:ribosome-associated translation inhibitor RaiA